jgi:hypothetical protein
MQGYIQNKWSKSKYFFDSLMGQNKVLSQGLLGYKTFLPWAYTTLLFCLSCRESGE